MPPQQYGIKVAQPGFDVRTCKDFELIFNSSWPSLSVVYDKTMSVTTDTHGSFIIPHNLGFTPLSMGWIFTDNTYSATQGRIFPNIDSNNIYFPSSTPGMTYYANFKCYNLDITIPQNYNYLQPSAVNSAYDPSFGIKVAKQNLAITSNDLRNFILHSRSASPQVLAVVTQSSITTDKNGNPAIIYTNPQGYTPWAFGYAQITNAFYGTIYQRSCYLQA